ncbi:phage tail tape measure protein [Chitinibacteraceae bacterium HSL-7]
MANPNNEVTLPLKVITDGEGKIRALAGEFDKLQDELVKTAQASETPGLAEQAARYGEIGASLRQVADEQAGLRRINAALRDMAQAGQLSGDEVERLAADLNKIGSNRAALVQFQALEARVTAADAALAKGRTTLNQTGAALDQARASAEGFAPQIQQAAQEVERSGKVYGQARQEADSFRAELARAGAATREQREALQALNLKVELARQQYRGAEGDLKTLERAHKAAGREADALARQVGQQTRQVDQAARQQQGYARDLATSRSALERMGATASNVASVERELVQSQEALRQKMQQLAQIGQSRDLLGVRAHDEIQREIKETIAAYDTLKKSGTLSQRELAQAALKTEERIRELEQQTNGWVESLGNARGALLGVGASLGGFAVAGRAAVDFESAMAGVSKVVDGSDEQISALGRSIQEMSLRLPVAATDLAKIAEAGGQMGVPLPKMGQFIELAAKMGTSFGISAEEAGQAVGKLTAIFGLPLGGIEQLSNALNTLGNGTAATEKGLLDFLTRVGGSAKQFGLTAEQVSALGGTFLAMGKTPEVAGTAVNALLQKLQTANVAGDDFKDALSRMGLSAQTLATDIRENPQAALDQFLGTLAAIEPQARAELLAQLFGLEYADDIAALTGSLGEYRKALNLVSDAQKNAGSLDREFEKRVQTTESQLTLMNNALKAVAVNFGSILLPAISVGAQMLGDLSGALAGFIDEHPAISLMAGSLGALALSLKGLKLAALAARVAFTGLTGSALPDLAALATQAGLSQTAFTLLSRSVAGVGAAFAGWQFGTYLRENFVAVEQFGTALAGGLHEIAEYVRYAWDLITATFTSDTWEAATERHAARLEQIRDTYAELFNEAAARGHSLAESSDRAAAGAKRLADASTEAGVGVDATGRAASQAAAKVVQLVDGIQQVKDAQQAAEQQTQRLNAAFGQLGIDGQQFMTGISSQSLKTIEAFQYLKNEVGSTGERLFDLYQKSLDSVDSVAAVDALRTQYEALGKEGRVSGEQLAKGLEATEKRLVAVKAALDPVNKAFAYFGIETKAQLTAAAEEARTQFDLMKRSGQATAQQLTQAYTAYAQKAIAANGGVVSELIKAEAAANGVTIEMDELGRAVVKAMRGGQEEVKTLADRVVSLGEEADATRQKLEGMQRQQSAGSSGSTAPRIEGRFPGTDENSTGFGRSAGGMNLVGIIEFLKGAGLAQERAVKIAKEFASPDGSVAYFENAGQKKYNGSTLTEALSNAAARELLRGPREDRPERGAGGNTQHTVNINLGGRSAAINVASPRDADALTSMLRELEDAAGRAA